MKLAITGGTGLVGRFLVAEARAAGDRVTLLGRRPGADPQPGHLPFDLDSVPPPLDGFDVLIHAALAHVPGRYRGGEGDDPEGFRRRNIDGTIRLFEAAQRAGVGHVIFLSSRAVYGDYPPGTVLREEMAPRPDTLYGAVKLEGERALATLARPGFRGTSLRATGVYGRPDPTAPHKWRPLFEDFLSGAAIPARAGTEVHGRDLAQAVRVVLRARAEGVFNVSDLVIDRHDLLDRVARLTGCPHKPPPPATAAPNVMDTARLLDLGWVPGGEALLEQSLPGLLPVKQ